VIDRRLEGLDMLHADPLGGVARGGEFGAQIEELALDAAEELVDRGRLGERSHEAQMAVEFVDGAEGVDSCVILANPRAAEEAGFTGVAGLGVDLHASALLKLV
jgi:hypothetical protein